MGRAAIFEGYTFPERREGKDAAEIRPMGALAAFRRELTPVVHQQRAWATTGPPGPHHRAKLRNSRTDLDIGNRNLLYMRSPKDHFDRKEKDPRPAAGFDGWCYYRETPRIVKLDLPAGSSRLSH
jgi:hypothetical protein